MSTAGLGPLDESVDGRWREWQERHAAVSGKDAARMRAIFTFLFLLVGAWLLWQWSGRRPDAVDVLQLGGAYVTPGVNSHLVVTKNEDNLVQATTVREWRS